MTLNDVLMLADLLLALVALPMVMGLVRPNQYYGIRTPQTLTDPALWYPANAFAGRAVLVAAVVSAAGLWLAPAPLLPAGKSMQPAFVLPLALFLLPLLAALAASFLHLRSLR